MDFSFSEEQEEFRAAVLDFAKHKLDLANSPPHAKSDAESYRERWRVAADFGLLGLPLPERYGGADLDLLTIVSGMEGLGYGCRDNGFPFSLNAHVWSVEMPILKFGTDAQRDRCLPRLMSGEWIGAHGITEESSGSDAMNLKTTATRHGDTYVLKGSKTFITNAPYSDLAVIFANEDPEAGPDGVSAFLVETQTPGIELSAPMEKMGMETSPMGQIFLDDCEIPASSRLGGEGAGSAIFTSSMDFERACILASNIGALKRQLEGCIEHARTWQRFGESIGKFQSVSNRIADMRVRLEAAQMLLYKAAWLKSNGKRANMESAMAKLYVSECMVQSSLDAIQLFGAYGYMKEGGVEADLRDAVGGTIYSGTSDIQRIIIARYLGL